MNGFAPQRHARKGKGKLSARVKRGRERAGQGKSNKLCVGLLFCVGSLLGDNLLGDFTVSLVNASPTKRSETENNDVLYWKDYDDNNEDIDENDVVTDITAAIIEGREKEKIRLHPYKQHKANVDQDLNQDINIEDIDNIDDEDDEDNNYFAQDEDAFQHYLEENYNPFKEIEMRIVGGKPADDKDAPYYVSFTEVDPDYGGHVHFCGGALIHSKIVLTAAHCVKEMSKRALKSSWVHVGNGRLGDWKQFKRSRIRGIRCHKKFSMNSVNNDICLVFLKSKISGVKRAKLPIKKSKKGAKVTIYGYGQTDEYDEDGFSYQMNKVSLPIISKKTCSAVMFDRSQPMLGNTVFCAGYKKGGKDGCQGDSGGPAMRGNIITGIVSWGEGCARPNRYGVYTDVYEYVDWICDNASPYTIANKICSERKRERSVEGDPMYESLPDLEDHRPISNAYDEAFPYEKLISVEQFLKEMQNSVDSGSYNKDPDQDPYIDTDAAGTDADTDGDTDADIPTATQQQQKLSIPIYQINNQVIDVSKALEEENVNLINEMFEQQHDFARMMSIIESVLKDYNLQDTIGKKITILIKNK